MDTSYISNGERERYLSAASSLRAPLSSDGGSIVGSFNTLVSDATPFQHLEISEHRMALDVPEQVRTQVDCGFLSFIRRVAVAYH